MEQPAFDPSASVQFDLGRGVVSLDGSHARVLVPSDLLLELCRSAGPEARRGFALRLGSEAARRVATRLAGQLEQASILSVVEHLGGDLALLGLGSLSVERWGRALVLKVEASPFGADGDELLAAVFEGALNNLFGREPTVLVLNRQAELVRLLVVNQTTAAAVRESLAAGVKWGDVLSRLHDAAERTSA
jgi:hypothetical protein